MDRGNAAGAIRFLAGTSSSLSTRVHAEIASLRGEALQSLGEFILARSAYKQSRRLFARIQDRSGELEAVLHLGDVERQLENFHSARAAYRSAFRIAQRHRGSSDNRCRAAAVDARMGEAMTLRGLGRYREAIGHLVKCEQDYRRHHDDEGRAYALWAIGSTFRFAGDLSRAEEALRRSLPIYLRLNDKSGFAYAMCGLGGTLRMRGMARQSGVLYRRANDIFRRYKDRFGLAYSHCGQGNAFRMQRQYVQALPHMKKAEQLYRSLQQKGPLGFVLWSRAQMDLAMRSFPDARRKIAEARRLFRSVKDARGLVYCDIADAARLRIKKQLSAIPISRRVERNARRHSLPFEAAHARSIRIGRPDIQAYRRCGVRFPAFLRYTTIP